MKRSNLLETTAYVAIIFIFSLVGCATGPISEVSDRAGVREPLPSGRRVEFHTKKFSVASPPEGWERTEEFSKAVAAWKNNVTKSVIQIFTSGAQSLSYRALAKALIIAVRVALEERNQKAILTLGEERETSLNGKRFYQVVGNYNISPTKGIQVRGKIVFYFLKTEAFFYTLRLSAILGSYEKDRLILEQMVRSFASLE